LARFLDSPEFIDASKETNRKVDVRVSIDWFDDGTLETIESASDEFIKLDLDRTLEGDIGTSIMDKGTLVLDNSNDDYSPKSIASRFNIDLGNQTYEFNIIPNRTVVVELSINGSDYYPYYYGIISNIESNYDNSRVSIDIEDEMMILQNEPARDQFFLEKSVKQVIETLLKDSAIDFNTNLVDDIDYIINYNFVDNTIFESLRLIAEMSWARFFVTDGELHFIDIQNLDEPNLTLIDTLEDEDFLQDGYSETYGAEDLYNKATVTSNPYKRAERDMIWTGAEKESEVSETYKGSDINTNILQLTYSTEEGQTKNTNNVPIAEGSVAVEFGNTVYTLGSGISSIDYLTGAITFTNSTEYPLPDNSQQVRVNYTYYLLTLAPAQNGEPYEKEIIAKHEFPSLDISDPNDYVKFEPVTGSKEYTPGSYKEHFNNLEYDDGGGSGDVVKWSNKITLDPNAINVRIAGKFDHSAYDHRFCFIGCYGGKRANPNSKVELYVNGSLHSQIYQTTKFGWSTFDSKKIAAGITGGDEIQLKLTLNRDCNKSSGIQIKDVGVNIGTVTVEQEQGTVGRVEIDPDYMNENRTKLIFRNYGEDEVIMYSEYEGKEIDNIYLTGIPFKQNSPIEKVQDNDDAARSFTLNSNELSINNDLIYDGSRAQRTADFLVDYYSTPKSVISVPIKGRPHYELLDKIHVNRDEADIDNDFLINEVSDSFTEDGEWNQTLTLRQARTSQWQYTDDGGANIVERVPIDTNAPQGRPPSVTNLNVTVGTFENEDRSFPSLNVSFNGNRFSRIYTIYLKRGNEAFNEVARVSEESFNLQRPIKSGTYTIKVQAESYDGIKEEFSTASEYEFSYAGTEPIDSNSIQLTEIKSLHKDGSAISYVLAEWSFPSTNNYGYTSVYIRRLIPNSKWGDIFNLNQPWTQIDLNKKWGYYSGYDFRLSQRTTENYIETEVLPEGDYEFKFVAEDRYGESQDFESAPTKQITIEGKTAPPSDVNIKKSQFNRSIILEWSNVIDIDLEGYEVRTDANFGFDDNNLIYKGKSNRLELTDFPLDGYAGEVRSYTFYIKAYNRSGIYSTNPEEVTVSNSAPNPPTLDITEFFESLWVEVNPPSDSDIEGFEIEVTEEGGSPEVFDIAIGERLTYSASVRSSYTVRARSYDVIGSGSWSISYNASTKDIDSVTQYASAMRPAVIVSSLPTLPNNDYPEGTYVTKITKDIEGNVDTVELYKNELDSWTSLSSPEFEEGMAIFPRVLAGTIQAGAISTDELAANAITAEKVGTNEIITDTANIANAVIDSASIIDLDADKVTVGGTNTNLSGVLNDDFQSQYNQLYKRYQKLLSSDYLAEPSYTWSGFFDLNSSWNSQIDTTLAWNQLKLQDLWEKYDSEYSNLQTKLANKTTIQSDYDNYYSAAENLIDYMQELENDLSRVPLEKLGIEEYAKQGQTIVEGGYLQTILISADRIDTGTLNAGNVTISSDDGTTFNLQGNDLTIDTNQFSLDSAGNAEFGGNLNAAGGTFTGDLSAARGTFTGSLDAVSGSFSDGNVDINSDGIQITDGGLTVSNSLGDTIIDGTSNMFKIHQTGTAYCGANSRVNIPFPDLGYRPSFMGFYLSGNNVFPTPIVAGIQFIAVVVTSRTNIQLRNDTDTGYNFRYYILKEESI